MDLQLRQLKRAAVSNPNDVEALHRYIAALERVVGGVEAKESPRRGWKCPDPDSTAERLRATDYGQGPVAPDVRPSSPDGFCVYDSFNGEDYGYPGRRVVITGTRSGIRFDGKLDIHPLPEDYQGHIHGESEDWCIFCGEPSERK